MKTLAALFTLAACASPSSQFAAPQPCVTSCGLIAENNCGELQARERRIVQGLVRFADFPSEVEVCGALKGWKLAPHVRVPVDDVLCGPRGWKLEGITGCVSGYTHLSTKTIDLLSDEWGRTRLAHEVVHVADFAISGHAGHCRWDRRGVKAALLYVDRFPDDSAPESDCPPD